MAATGILPIAAIVIDAGFVSENELATTFSFAAPVTFAGPMTPNTVEELPLLSVLLLPFKRLVSAPPLPGTPE